MPNSPMEETKPGKVFNDCVHGHIELPPLCIAIIDTDIFQRLRHLKQLGFSYYVYPGAAHNRFEHSLGVCYLAGIQADALNNQGISNDVRVSREEKLCLQVAGLCHDLGHGPFSHVWENVLKRMGVEEWTHEDMSIKMLDEIFKIEKVKQEFTKSRLQEKHKDMIRDMIRGRKGEERAFLYEIISNKDTGIDVDKWDYLLRDGKQLNINVTFDPYRLIKCQKIINVNDEGDNHNTQYQICYRDKDQGNIWHMYMMRAELHRLAYQHPITKIIEEMFTDACLHLKDVYSFKGKLLTEIQEDPSIFKYFSDDIFQEILRADENEQAVEEAKKLLSRILHRKLYLVVGKKTLSIVRDEADMEIDRIQENLRTRQEMENAELDLHIITLQWSMEDLQRSVNIFTKSNPTRATTTHGWSSVPFYRGQVHHTQILLICKNEEYPIDIDRLREIASDILKNKKIKRKEEPSIDTDKLHEIASDILKNKKIKK